MRARQVRIGVIGDVHMAWHDRDRRWFAQSGYDLLLFVGDLASYWHDGRTVARSIAPLGVPALVMPGNHDGVSLPLLVAEALRSDRWSHRLSSGMRRRCRALEQALGPVPMVGFSAHSFELGGVRLSVVAGRPHSMGGRRLSFVRYLSERFGVSTLEQAARRLEELVDDCDAERLIFLAHNGPTGLGDGPADIWGCDFKPELGDFGDEELRHAVDHARSRGKRVLAVVAGHMHHRVRGGAVRRWHVVHEGVHYVNAARVPRIERRHGGRRAHHVLLTTDGEHTTVEEVWVA